MQPFFVLCLCLASLVGCSRQNDAATKSATSEGAKPAPAVEESASPAVDTTRPPNLAPTATPPAAPATPASDGTIVVKKVVVLQEGTKTGIAATISRIATDDKKFYFSVTDDQGLAAPNQPCSPTDRFDVEPTLPVYLKIGPKPCAETLAFVLSSAQATYALVILGNEAKKANDFATAQLYYASAASRLRSSNPAESLLLGNQAKIAAGKALGVARPTVNVNGEEVFTVETVLKLRAFQEAKKLNATNILDPATTGALAPIDDAEAVRRALAIPPGRVETYKISPAVIEGSKFKASEEMAKSIESRYDIKAMTNLEKGKEASIVRAVKAPN